MASETERLLGIKAAITQTTNTIGWSYIKGFWANIEKKAIQDALDETDPIKAEGKRLKAKALQQAFVDVFTAMDQIDQLQTEREPEWFSVLNAFEGN